MDKFQQANGTESEESSNQVLNVPLSNVQVGQEVEYADGLMYDFQKMSDPENVMHSHISQEIPLSAPNIPISSEAIMGFDFQNISPSNPMMTSSIEQNATPITGGHVNLQPDQISSSTAENPVTEKQPNNGAELYDALQAEQMPVCGAENSGTDIQPNSDAELYARFQSQQMQVSAAENLETNQRRNEGELYPDFQSHQIPVPAAEMPSTSSNQLIEQTELHADFQSQQIPVSAGEVPLLANQQHDKNELHASFQSQQMPISAVENQSTVSRPNNQADLCDSVQSHQVLAPALESTPTSKPSDQKAVGVAQNFPNNVEADVSTTQMFTENEPGTQADLHGCIQSHQMPVSATESPFTSNQPEQKAAEVSQSLPNNEGPAASTIQIPTENNPTNQADPGNVQSHQIAAAAESPSTLNQPDQMAIGISQSLPNNVNVGPDVSIIQTFTENNLNNQAGPPGSVQSHQTAVSATESLSTFNQPDHKAVEVSQNLPNNVGPDVSTIQMSAPNETTPTQTNNLQSTSSGKIISDAEALNAPALSKNGSESDIELEGIDLDDDDDDDEEEGDEDTAETILRHAESEAPPSEGADSEPVSEVEEDDSVEDARKQHKLELEQLKEKQAEEDRKSAEDKAVNKQKRLTFLMKQSEIFTHFLSEGGALAAKGAATKGAKNRNRISEAEEDSMMMKAALSKARITRLEKQPSLIVNGTLRPYQLEGLNWLIKLYDNGINGILADEMGLGKTLQSIALLAYLREARGVKGPHLVLVPKSTLGNWIREFKKWCPSIRTVKMIGTKEERNNIMNEAISKRNFDVMATSYEACLREKGRIARIRWKYLIIDEAHRIKNENSSLSKAVRSFDTSFRLLITGTPLQNNLHELWALLNFLLPDIFTSSEDFDRWFDFEGSDDQRQSMISKLHTILRPFMIRRIKADVAKDLPPKTETKLFVGLSNMQRAWYASLLQKDASHLNALGGPSRTGLLNILMQLRKVCNHPYLFEGAEPGPPYEDGPHLWENCGKMAVLEKLLPKLKKAGSRVLIFCQMVRALDILEDYLNLKRYQYCRIDGSTSGENRDQYLDDFNEPGSKKFVFLLSTRAGGLGINLATADTVVLYDSDWNPQVDLQAMDRAHRIGQTKPVSVFRLIAEGTVEEKIVERADKKLFLDAAVIQQGRLAQQHKKLTNGELMHMVRFGADAIMSAKEGTLTDEDIDTLLKRCTEKTQNMNEKFKTDVQHSLANFSLDDNKNDASVFYFEGEDYRENNKSKGKVQSFINLPQRERRHNYNENEYFRGAMSGESSFKKKKLRRMPMADFQFYNEERLDKIFEKESTLFQQSEELRAKVKELRTQELYLRRQDEVLDPNGLNPGDLANQLEAAIPRLCLSEEEQKEKDELINSGFGSWTRADFKVFVSALERNGREDINTVKAEVAEELGKSEEEIAAYHQTFLKRYKELKDWKKIIQKIEKAEEKIHRKIQIRQAIRSKVDQYEDPLRTLTLDYKNNPPRFYTKENDAFLVVMMHRFGYGNWERIRVEIRKAWQFRFDWYFKTRNAVELQRRSDVLIQIIENELQKENPRKRKNSEEEISNNKKSKTS